MSLSPAHSPYAHASDPLSLDRDTFHHLMRVSRRRYTTRYLAAFDPSVTIRVGDLAELVASDERDKPRRAITSNERKAAYVPLVDKHLPKLAEYDIVEYDKTRKTVSPGPEIQAVADVLCFEDRFFES